MSSSDPYPQGGSLSDMAVEGTKIPDDAGKPNLIPSKAPPDLPSSNNLGASSLVDAADNAGDVGGVSKSESAGVPF